MTINIVLIGMPGSGKTTVGMVLSRLTPLRFIDLDKQIENHLGIPVPRIFAEYGEPFFRKAESEEAAAVSGMNGVIISCGGGIVLNEKNMDNLRRNGTVFYLECSPEILCERIKKGNRPLLTAFGDIYKIFNEREHLYKKYSDYTIDNGFNTPEQSATKILEYFNIYGEPHA